MKFDEVYLVKCFYDLCSSHDVFVMKADLMKFVRAAYKLHVNPCRNPHNGNECLRYRSIQVYDMGQPLIGQYWWASPDLHVDKNGARTVDFGATCVHRFNFEKFYQRAVA